MIGLMTKSLTESLIRGTWLATAAIAMLACGLVFASNVDAAVTLHPYHVTRAEVEYNSTRQTFQVALCVWPEDLQKAVSKIEGKAVNVDSEPEANLNLLMKKYVASKFRFLPAVASDEKAEGTETGTAGKEDSAAEPEPKPAEIRWVGSEVKIKQAWLYFEIDASAGTEWQIENRLFLEFNEDQLNQVQIRNGKQWFSKTLSATLTTANWSHSK
jgi:hypothetical protein